MIYKVRPATQSDALGIAKVHVQGWLDTYTGIIPDEYIAKRNVPDCQAMWEKILSPENSTRIMYVALDESDTIIGFVNGGPAREKSFGYDSELYAIYLIKEHKGQGVGRVLFDALTDTLKKQGYKSMYLWVLKDNPTVEVYKSLGGIETEINHEEDYGGKVLSEVIYAWELN
jgi:L-amino acid N-acyltransferase YncA